MTNRLGLSFADLLGFRSRGGLHRHEPSSRTYGHQRCSEAMLVQCGSWTGRVDFEALYYG